MPWTVVLEKTLEGPLDNKEIKPVNPKGNQSRIFVWRTDAEAEAPILWPPDGKCWLIGKAPDVGGDWGHEEKGATEDEMIGWYHWLNRQESEQILGDSEGQGSLDAAVHSVAKSWTWLSYWTAITLIWVLDSHCCLLKTFLPQAWCWATTPVNLFQMKNLLCSQLLFHLS